MSSALLGHDEADFAVEVLGHYEAVFAFAVEIIWTPWGRLCRWEYLDTMNEGNIWIIWRISHLTKEDLK